VLAIVLTTGCLLWLAINPEKTLPVIEKKE
jgi:hypothetical protein